MHKVMWHLLCFFVVKVKGDSCIVIFFVGHLQYVSTLCGYLRGYNNRQRMLLVFIGFIQLCSAVMVAVDCQYLLIKLLLVYTGDVLGRGKNERETGLAGAPLFYKMPDGRFRRRRNQPGWQCIRNCR